jgi:hypothetical protein
LIRPKPTRAAVPIEEEEEVEEEEEGKAVPVQPWTGPECSRRLKLPDFKTIGT